MWARIMEKHADTPGHNCPLPPPFHPTTSTKRPKEIQMKQHANVKNLSNLLGYYNTLENSVVLLNPINKVEINMHHSQGRRKK